jgi:thiamine kinase-like enzyme
MDTAASIAGLLERVPAWVGRAVEWQRLQGGLSHHIYRVDVDGETYVLRVLDPSIQTTGLGIDPALEVANTQLAAATGAGPKVFEVLPDVPAIVIEFLPGRTLGIDDVRQPDMIPKIAHACRRLHSGEPFRNGFDIFDKRDELLGICARNDLPLPAGYLDYTPTVRAVQAALNSRPLPSRPCHNDLLAENFIETDNAVRIVDYQLSGNNDPAFELGDIAAEADYDPDLAGLLTAAYFKDETTAALEARVRLFLLASNVTWTLWFTVHHGLLRGSAAVDFDYDAEAADKWAQARRDLDDPGLGRLLDVVSGRIPTPNK